MKKRLFQVLDEMNVHDGEHNTRFIAVSSAVVEAKLTKQGTLVTMGADAQTINDIGTDKAIPLLILVDRAEYKRRIAETTPDIS